MVIPTPRDRRARYKHSGGAEGRSGAPRRCNPPRWEAARREAQAVFARFGDFPKILASLGIFPAVKASILVTSAHRYHGPLPRMPGSRMQPDTSTEVMK